MALSMTTVIAQVRDLVATVSGINRVYAASETDDNAIPPAINEFPAAMVIPGASQAFITTTGRHTYEVKIQIFESGMEIGQRAATVLPFVDALIALFVENTTLGNRCNSCVFQSASGLIGLTYGGVEYTGYEIGLEVSEQAYTQPAIGA